MSTSTITSTITDGSGTAVADGTVIIARLMPGGRGFRSNGTECLGYEATTTTSGAYSLTLERNADIAVPTNTWWEIEEQVAPSAGGPSTWAINTDASGTVYSRLVTPSADTGLEAHLTESQADARYALIGQSGTNLTIINVRTTYGTSETAIQAAATAAYNAGGGILWFHGGNFDWSAATALYIDGATDVWMSPDSYFTVEGGETKGGIKVFMALGVNARWTGKLWRVNFREGGSLSGLSHLVSIFDAERFAIEGCTVYSTTSGSFSDGNIFKGLNVGAWKTASGTVRRRGRIVNNIIDVNQTAGGSEGISISGVDATNRAEDILIQGNYVSGVGDDPIALHSFNRCKILGNQCISVDGRIVWSDGTSLTIADNDCEHTSTLGGTAYIWGCFEAGTAAIYQAPTDVLIADNRMLCKSGQTNVTYGIRLLGCQQVTVRDNKFRNRNTSASVINAISVESMTHDSVLRKAGFISIAGNDIRGGRIHVEASSGRDFWTKVGPNVVDGRALLSGLVDYPSCGDVAGDEVIAGGCTGGAAYEWEVSGFAVSNLTLLGVWHLKDLPVGATTSLTLQNPDLTISPQARAFAVTTIESVFGTAPSHTTTINVNVNGSLWKAATHTTAGKYANNYGTTGARYSTTTQPAGAEYDVAVVTNALFTANQDILVRLWGIPVP